MLAPWPHVNANEDGARGHADIREDGRGNRAGRGAIRGPLVDNPEGWFMQHLRYYIETMNTAEQGATCGRRSRAEARLWAQLVRRRRTIVSC
jgi:hypothetical protein